MKLLHIHAEDAEEEKCRSLRPCPFGEFSSASYAAVQNKTQSFIDTTLLTAPRVARARTKMTNGSGPFDVAMDVSTINRLLQEVVQKERRLRRELHDTVEKKELISCRMVKHQSDISSLETVRNHSASLLDDIKDTSLSARAASDQVRQLDTAHGHAQEAIARVSLNADVTQCMDGVTSSLENKEYEAAAHFVDTLAKLHNFVPQEKGITASDSENAQFVRVRDAVARVVREELHTAASKSDVLQVLRFAKLFPKLCLSDEGLTTVCLQLRKLVTAHFKHGERTWSAENIEGNDSGPTSLLAELFESVVTIVDQHGDDLTSSFGGAAVHAVVQSLNKECDICGAQLLKRYIVRALQYFPKDQRNILQIAKDVSLRSKKQGESNVDPRCEDKMKKWRAEQITICLTSKSQVPPTVTFIDFQPVPFSRTRRLIEEYLEEIVSICQVSIKYNRYLKERLQSSSTKEASAYHLLHQQNPVSTKTFDGEHYFRVLHEMVGFYIRLEEFYMYETVAVAIKINERGETLTSSVVDDVFYILQKCARRASETGSIQAVCASLHHVSNILSDQVLSFVQHELAEVSQEGFTDILSKDSKESLHSWTTAVNNAEIIFENVNILTRDIQEYLLLLFDIPGEWERISNCLNEIRETSQFFEHCSHNSLKVFANTSLQSVDNALMHLSSTSFELDDLDQEDQDSLDSWVHHLLIAVDHLLHALKPLLVTSCFRAFLHAFEESLALRIEVVLLNDLRFTQLGGLLLERSVRRIVFHLSTSFPEAPCRELFGRVLQISMMLSMESPSEVLDYWNDLLERLSEIEIKRVLSLRSDFRVADVNALGR